MATDNQERLRAATTGHDVAKREPQSFPQMLIAYKDQIAAALPKHLNGDRMGRIALTCFRQNPDLQNCDPKSVFAAVVIGSQLGLEPGIMGQAYLIPYGRTCQFIPGWKGMQDLVNRSGRASTWTGAVYVGDQFEYEMGTSPYLTHKRGTGEKTADRLQYCYAIGRVKGAEWPVIEVWSKKEIEQHRDRFNKVGKKHYSFNNFEMYGRKVVLLQVIKYMPTSIEVATANSLNDAGEAGTQVIELKDAIDGTFMPVEDSQTDSGSDTSGSGGSGNAVDEDSCIASIKAAKSQKELDDAWDAVLKMYSDANKSVPLAVEAARNDRKEFLR